LKQYILSFVDPKHTKSICYPEEYRHILCDSQLLNRLMKEYLVHIEMNDNDKSHKLIFHSSTLTVLFLALDDFRKAISSYQGSDTSLLQDTQSLLRSLSVNFESQVTTVDEKDQFNDEASASPTMKNPEDDNEEPKLKIAFPGAELVPIEKESSNSWFFFVSKVKQS